MLKQQLLDELKLAMKSGDTVKRDALRMLDSMIKNVEIEKQKRETGLSDEETTEVISKAVKQRKDASMQYIAGGREDLAKKEQAEIEILSAYLPAQLDEKAVRETVKAIISEIGVATPSDIGRVMGIVMGKLKGQADGNLVKKIAEEELQK